MIVNERYLSYHFLKLMSKRHIHQSTREANFVQLFSEKLEPTEFFEPMPLELDSFYNLIKYIKEKGLPFPNSCLW